MDSQTYGDVECLKNPSQSFCPYQTINLMDYTDDKVKEKFKVDYSNDIKLLSCDQKKLNKVRNDQSDLTKEDIEYKILNDDLIDRKLLEKRFPNDKKIDHEKNEKHQISNKSNNSLPKQEDNHLSENQLINKLMICNSKNIFNEISEDLIEEENLNVTSVQSGDSKSIKNINDILNSTSSDQSQTNDQMISINIQQNKDLIDKNLISLATQKLLKNNQLEQMIKDQPLMMQIEDLETILKNDKTENLNEFSRELIEQSSEQPDKQIEVISESNDDKHDRSNSENDIQNELSDDKNLDHKNDQIKTEPQLIERLDEPIIEQISEFRNNLDQKSEQNDFEEERTISQYNDDTLTTRESQNTTPIDSEYSFKYLDNRMLLKENSVDYEEVFDECYDDLNDDDDESYLDRLKRLEEEQEHLNSSLIALTSHFAKVQLRLKQIVDASPENKESLLKDLEEFAFRGIPDYRLPQLDELNESSNSSFDEKESEHSSNCQKSNKLQLQRDKQKELILKLKEQLEDLEKYAYETGDPNIIPSSLILEKQSVIIEELKGKLPLELDKLEKMSPEELRKQIDKAIRDLVNPVIMKEQLVDQLKTQVSDLERFIEFLQEGKICIKSAKKGGLIFDGNVNQLIAKCKCNCTSKHSQECVSYDDDEKKRNETSASANERHKTKNRNSRSKSSKENGRKADEDELNDNEKAAKIIERAFQLLQMFTFVHFGCNTKSMMNKPNKFERNILKKTNKINHWGDLRAKLEITIDHLIELTKQKHLNDSDYTSECEEVILIQANEKITNTVRKQLCVLLRDLLEHGLNTNLNGCVSSDDRVMHQNDSLMSWNCFSQKSRLINYNDRRITIWDVLINYFYLKKGDRFRQTPARKLSLSFNLEIIGGVPITSKQTLLSCIDEIMDTHTKLKRSADSHFKAFVSRALNEKRLVSWLKLIFKCKTIVNRFYEQWSYVNSSAFDEGLKSLDRLTSIDWQLPTDIAIRQLQNINDAF